MINQIEQMEIFRSLKLSLNFFQCRTVFEHVAQKSFGMHPLSHTQKIVDKSLIVLNQAFVKRKLVF